MSDHIDDAYAEWDHEQLVKAYYELRDALQGMLNALAMGPLEIAAKYGPDVHPDEAIVDAAHKARKVLSKADVENSIELTVTYGPNPNEEVIRIETDASKTTVCPKCDGLGEWDEGPINCGGPAPVDPIYRQVKCPTCEGTGRVSYAFPPRSEAALREYMTNQGWLGDDDPKF